MSPLCLCLSVSPCVFVSTHMRQREKKGGRKDRERERRRRRRDREFGGQILTRSILDRVIHLVFLDRNIHGPGIFLIRVGWMVNYLQGSFCLAFQVCNYMHVVSCRVFSLQLKGSNSSPHACMASTLLIEPSPQTFPICFHLEKNYTNYKSQQWL